jgi:alkylhydroperoxidase family enzyme
VEIDDAITLAIDEAVKAGVFWRAARFNPKSRTAWAGFAELHHDNATAYLDEVVDRLSACGAGPCTECGR